jgi:hypothetical protein
MVLNFLKFKWLIGIEATKQYSTIITSGVPFVAEILGTFVRVFLAALG